MSNSIHDIISQAIGLMVSAEVIAFVQHDTSFSIF